MSEQSKVVSKSRVSTRTERGHKGPDYAALSSPRLLTLLFDRLISYWSKGSNPLYLFVLISVFFTSALNRETSNMPMLMSYHPLHAFNVSAMGHGDGEGDGKR